MDIWWISFLYGYQFLITYIHGMVLHGNPNANHLVCGNIHFLQKSIFGRFNANNFWTRVQNNSKSTWWTLLGNDKRFEDTRRCKAMWILTRVEKMTTGDLKSKCFALTIAISGYNNQILYGVFFHGGVEDPLPDVPSFSLRLGTSCGGIQSSRTWIQMY